MQRGGRPSGCPLTNTEARMRGGSLQCREPRAGKFCQVFGYNRVRGARERLSMEDTIQILFTRDAEPRLSYGSLQILPTRGKVLRNFEKHPHPGGQRYATGQKGGLAWKTSQIPWNKPPRPRVGILCRFAQYQAMPLYAHSPLVHSPLPRWLSTLFSRLECLALG